jgi:hypothetical protein
MEEDIVVSHKTRGKLEIVAKEPLSIRKLVNLLVAQPIPSNFFIEELHLHKETRYDSENRQTIETGSWKVTLDWESSD